MTEWHMSKISYHPLCILIVRVILKKSVSEEQAILKVGSRRENENN